MATGFAESTKRLCYQRRAKLPEGKAQNAEEWLRQRRTSVRDAVANAQGSKQAGADKGLRLRISKMAASLWSKRHEKEKHFNESKLQSKRASDYIH